MTDSAAAERAAGQRRLTGATAALAVASLGGAGLVVATLAAGGTTAATPGTVGQLPTTTVRGEQGRDDDGLSFGFQQQAPQFSFQPPVARSSGS